MKLNMSLDGVDELNKKVERMQQNLSYENMEKIMLESAEEVKKGLVAAAPVGPTGNLRRSPIAKAMPKSRAPVVIAGIDRKIAPHAHLVEFGTVKMPAQPFFRPTWDGLRGKVNKDIASKTGKAVEKL